MNDVTSWFSAVLIGGMLLISLCLWTYVIRRHRSGQLHFFSARERLKVPLGLIDVLLAFVMWMMGQMVGLAITFAILGIDELSPASMTAAQHTVLGFSVGICTVVSTVLILAYLYGRYQNPKVFGGSLKHLSRDIGLGCLVFMCFVPVTFLVQAALTQVWDYEHPTLDLISPDASFLTILSAWWMAVLVAPISEEIFFRAVLQGWLSRLFVNNVRPETKLTGGWPGRHSDLAHVTSEKQPDKHQGPMSAGERASAVAQGEQNPYESPTHSAVEQRGCDESPLYVAQAWAPVVISSLMFGLVHLGQGPAPIPIFVFALGLGMIYRQTGRIVPCIVAHFLLNCFSMSVFTIEQLFFPPDAIEAIPELEPAMSWLASWIL